jgi:DNA-binding CsgD family transcriptional regulator
MVAGSRPKTLENQMQHIEIEILAPLAARYMESAKLTPAERSEVLRIAQGYACKDSAAQAGISPETIRARRKRIYRKLDVAGSTEILSALVALSLQMLARGERIGPRSEVAVPENRVAPPDEVQSPMAAGAQG